MLDHNYIPVEGGFIRTAIRWKSPDNESRFMFMFIVRYDKY